MDSEKQKNAFWNNSYFLVKFEFQKLAQNADSMIAFISNLHYFVSINGFQATISKIVYILKVEAFGER